MIDPNEIKADMPVTTAQAEHFAVVDRLESDDVIKLKKDGAGVHHYIPVSWVLSTEGGIVKINRTLAQITQDWQAD
ncbi:DUF2171 domain-containing protein [Methylophilus sp. QUAN]|uniref:DUF2171 domain-containing protein n=1 Tax=Methylophilus sp. QUAN TaxID=2781020 RepID=UPI00188ED58C|nr:DUF2171 domain-containing protein [Methylophilus sp. QUAN]MBF4990197.1 DUF2171 domain-containing protein [Methylophilus sp. QUAN]